MDGSVPFVLGWCCSVPSANEVLVPDISPLLSRGCWKLRKCLTWVTVVAAVN